LQRQSKVAWRLRVHVPTARAGDVRSSLMLQGQMDWYTRAAPDAHVPHTIPLRLTDTTPFG